MINSEKYFQKIKKKIGKSIYDHQLLEENDNVMIALSGGKDSLVLLEVLSMIKKNLPFKINFLACHVIAKGVGYHIDRDYMDQFCKRNDIPLYYKEITIDIDKTKKKHPCFVCSWHRRKKLFEICRELKCNKLAFGHHMDDAIETLFMNMIYHGSISSLPQKISFFDGDIEVIRPLLNLKEEDIKKYADLRNIEKELKSCNYEDRSTRFTIKQFISEFEKLNKQSKINIFRSMDNMYSDYLPKNK